MGAFYGCQLSKIDIPNGVTRIENSAFGNNSKLKTIWLPSSLEYIDCAFGSCPNIENIYSFKEEPPIINEFTFDKIVFSNAKLLVHDVSKYKEAPCWEYFQNIKDMDAGYTYISRSYDITAIGNGEIIILPDQGFDLGAGWELLPLFEGETVRDEQRIIVFKHWATQTGADLELIPDEGNIVKKVQFTPTWNGTLEDVTSQLTPLGNGKMGFHVTDMGNVQPKIVVTFGPKNGEVEKPGDLTGDTEVDGMDLVALVNVIMGTSTQTSAADLNGDGDVDGMDYVAMVNIIMGTAYSRSTEDVEHHVNIGMEPLTIAPGESRELTITLQNADMDVTMVQADLKLPQGLSLTGEYTLGNRTTERNHQLYMSGQDGQHRLMLASPKNALLSGTEGAILRLTLTADASFQGGDIVLSNMLCASPTLQAARQQQAVLSLGGTNGITDIDAMGKAAGKKVYSLSGQRMTAPRKGVNIIGGKKYVVK